jgi:hypothetical protein
MPSAAIGAVFGSWRATNLRSNNGNEKIQQAKPQPAAGGPPLEPIKL